MEYVTNTRKELWKRWGCNNERGDDKIRPNKFRLLLPHYVDLY